MAAQVALPEARYAEGSRIAGFYDEALQAYMRDKKDSMPDAFA